MSLEKLLEEGRLKKHATSRQEIVQLLAVVERDLRDAQISALSADRKFATAYSAALQSGRAILAAKGYRTSGEGHHMTVFLALKSVLGKEHHPTMDYFNDCRNKRNLADYGVSGIVSEKEVQELVEQARNFDAFTRAWLKKHYPKLV